MNLGEPLLLGMALVIFVAGFFGGFFLFLVLVHKIMGEVPDQPGPFIIASYAGAGGALLLVWLFACLYHGRWILE